MFLSIGPGETIEIMQTGKACYEMKVSNCEILKVTEKFLIETFVKVNEEYL